MSRGTNDLKGRVNRFRVFRYVKLHMERFEECPSAGEVADELGMSPSTAAKHMQALRGASGLPMPIPSGAVRRAAYMQKSGVSSQGGVARGVADRHSVAPWAPIPVDVLIRGGGR